MLHLTVFHLFSAGLSFSVGLSYVFHIFWGPSALRRFTSLSFVYFLRVFHEFSIFSGGLHRFSVSFVHFLRALYSLPSIHFARWLSYVLCEHLSLFLRCCHLYQILRLSLELGYIYIYSQKRLVYTKRDFWLQYIKRNICIRYCASALSSTRYIYIVKRDLYIPKQTSIYQNRQLYEILRLSFELGYIYTCSQKRPIHTKDFKRSKETFVWDTATQPWDQLPKRRSRSHVAECCSVMQSVVV